MAENKETAMVIRKSWKSKWRKRINNAESMKEK